MEEIKIKLKIFTAIANNSQNLCATRYMNPSNVASWTNEVYEILTKTFNSNN